MQPRQQFNNNNQTLPFPPYVVARPTVTHQPFRPSAVLGRGGLIDENR